MPPNPPSKRHLPNSRHANTLTFQKYFKPPRNEILDTPLIICIVFMYLFVICSSCSSFIPIRNLKLYTNVIATPIDAHYKVEIIHYMHILA